MIKKIWPILLVVFSNTLYNICAKSVPEDLNSFFALIFTYSIAIVLTIILYFITSESKDFIEDLKSANWACAVLGLSIVAVEFGFFEIYRVGWKIGLASLVTNIMLAVALVFVGFFLYREKLNWKQFLGILLCGVGLILINI